jgi:hypothetical protein
MLKALSVMVISMLVYVPTQAQKIGAISCTAWVNHSDCAEATASFSVTRDNKIFNSVDVIIADTTEFDHQKSQLGADMTRRFKNGETGLMGPLLSGEDQDFVLIFLDKRPSGLSTITKVVVSVDAFYKLDIDAKGLPTKEKHFDSTSALILAGKINGYVVGWFYGQLATIH